MGVGIIVLCFQTMSGWHVDHFYRFPSTNSTNSDKRLEPREPFELLSDQGVLLYRNLSAFVCFGSRYWHLIIVTGRSDLRWRKRKILSSVLWGHVAFGLHMLIFWSYCPLILPDGIVIRQYRTSSGREVRGRHV